MRTLVAILFFMLTAQPAPAGACDSHDPGAPAVQAGMQHDMAAHAHKQQDTGGAVSAHDCCDNGNATDNGCSTTAQCGACAHGVAAVTLALAFIPAAPPAAVPVIHAGDPLMASHTSQPYRPPRTIS